MKRLLTTTAGTLLIAIVWIAPVPAAAQQPAKILILPFDINAPQEYAYLKEGIYDMLVSRLAAIPGTVLIDRGDIDAALKTQAGPLGPADAVALGRTLSADYVAWGAFTMFGDNISTDAQFYDLKADNAQVNFNRTGQSPGELIAHVNQFSDQIKSSVFGLPVATRSYPPPAGTTQPAAPAPAPAAPAPSAPAPAPAPSPSGVQSGLSPGPVPEVPFALTQSRRMKTAILGLSLGDINGDKITELVFVDESRLYIYQFKEKRYHKIDELSAGRSHQLLGVDAADINQNGVAEIFVTSALPDIFLNSYVQDIYTLNSYVLEFKDGRYARIQEDSDWYFRVTRSAEQKDMLLGQQRAKKEVFLSTKYELAWKDGAYKPARTLPVPDQLNIFGLAFGDILQDGQTETIGFTFEDHLAVFDPQSREIWASLRPLGGSRAYLQAEDSEAGKLGNHKFSKRVFLSQRILVKDADKNGAQQVVVVNNIGSRVLKDTRIFKKSLIECLAWDGSGLSPKWKTREFDGYISDYAIGDLDNDGADELVFALVQRKGTLMTSDRSTLFMMELK